MISLKDLLALLDRYEDWKRIKELPDRVEELEARIAQLEKGPPNPNLRYCPKCDAYEGRPDGPPRLLAGGKKTMQYFRCKSCGHGYRELLG